MSQQVGKVHTFFNEIKLGYMLLIIPNLKKKRMYCINRFFDQKDTVTRCKNVHTYHQVIIANIMGFIFVNLMCLLSF